MDNPLGFNRLADSELFFRIFSLVFFSHGYLVHDADPWFINSHLLLNVRI